MPRKTAKGASANDVPLRQIIFSQPLSAYNIPLIKHILSIFYQQSTFRQREPRISLLHKLARVESSRTDKERNAVAQLLRLNIPITRAAVKVGPHDEDVDRELLGVEYGTDCEVCLRTLPLESFPQQDFGSKCNHKADICASCLEQAITVNVKSNSWNNVPCPYSSCERMLESSVVRKYLKGQLLEKYNSSKDQPLFRKLISQSYNNYVEKLEIRNLPNFRWCLNTECVSGQVHNEGVENLRVICRACQSESCFLHQIPRGEGKKCVACDNAVSRLEEIAKTLRVTKLCPRCKVLTIMDPLECGKAFCSCGYFWENFRTGH